ncbi:MAG: Lrp/AsnC family transcriptional regulator [Oscillospiraceae bacterium]|jgi:Lrp/AsnC family leucine-responsive transcriptional regulator|nr:Lrp/AsnC family transcriptional regulator [Oscillospiraceae bacterium]
MDALDLKILDRLTRNARCRASALSQEVNLSVSAVIERIRKLEDSGVIRGYTAVLDQKLLGNDIGAWMEIRLEHPRHYDAFAARVNAHPNILACHYLTGDYDFILHVVARSSEALEAVHREITGIPGVSSAKTHFVLKSVKEAF